MPYDIRRGVPGCDGFAVVSDTGKVTGCHATRAGARAQQRALYANVPDARKMLGFLTTRGHRTKADAIAAANRILTDTPFWDEYQSTLIRDASPLFIDVFRAGMKAALRFPEVQAVVQDAIPANLRTKSASEKAVTEAVRNALGNLVSTGQAAVESMMQQWAAGIAQTTRNTLIDALARAREQSLGSPYVYGRIKDAFDPARAHRIAVTETTRFFGAGSVSVYRAAELPGWEWQTVEDALVCPICSDLSGTQFRVAADFGPAHPACRCFPKPVTELSDRELEGKNTDPGEYPLSGFNSLDDMLAWARARYPHIDWQFDGAALNNLNNLFPTLDRLMQQYPAVTARYRLIGTKNYDGTIHGPNTLAYQRYNGTEMAWNPHYFNNPKWLDTAKTYDIPQARWKWDPKAGETKQIPGIPFHPTGTGSPAGIVAHEFGHAIDGYYSGYGVDHIGFQTAWSSGVSAGGGVGLVTNLINDFKNVKAVKLSVYATESAGEKFAEAFSQLTMTPKSQWNPYTKKLDKFLQTVHPSNLKQSGEWKWLGDIEDPAMRRAVAQSMVDDMAEMGIKKGL